tara:strand:+ start:981 stop:1307 length:327 start_codon:yes stop_codon:yes gene_type:complete
MDIPIANTVEININPGTIINDNSNNLIYTDVEPTQLTNQTATLEPIISLSPQSSRNTFFSITIPNYTIIRSNNFDYKIKVLGLFCFFCYSNLFLISVILMFNHRRQEE